MILKRNFTYIDLFAGIGGFHCAMDEVSQKKAVCLYASEIDKYSAKVYEDNFKIKPLGDICQVDPSKYPSPDVVCAGFPCQAFSKAGKQNGFKDTRGTLFREIIRIIKFYKSEDRPKILILENVRNLASHDQGNTWLTIRHEIKKAGYNVCETPIIMAPKDIGIPQLRDRAIILAVRNDLYSHPISFPFVRQTHNVTNINSIISDDLSGSKKLSKSQLYALRCWDDFMHHSKQKVIGFPIWSDEFDKNYDLTSYPVWKQDIIKKNRKMYVENKSSIDQWLKKWDVRNKMTPTFRKFEWQANTKISGVFEGIIQFRTSGIRVKRATESPALVAMAHIPIIGPLKRTISIREAARLQSFPDSFRFDEDNRLAYKQLGNAVNVKVIKTSFEIFLKSIGCNWGD